MGIQACLVHSTNSHKPPRPQNAAPDLSPVLGFAGSGGLGVKGFRVWGLRALGFGVQTPKTLNSSILEVTHGVAPFKQSL